MSIVEVVRKTTTVVEVGHPGVQGPPGTDGAQGPTGATGSTGPTGPSISDHYTTHIMQGIL